MDRLREEFLRASDQFPELGHALVTWEVRPEDFVTTTLELLKDTDLEVIGLGSTLATDRRTESVWLWDGPRDAVKARRAIAEFEDLARKASTLIEHPKTLPGAIPPRSRVLISDGVVDRTTGEVVTTSELDDSTVDRWLTHVFIVSAKPQRVERKSAGERVIWACELRILMDVFRESEFWLAHPSGVEASRDSRPAETVNGRMQAELASNMEVVKGWTARQWASHLNCSVSSIGDAQTWKNLELLRKNTKAEKAMDRHRKSKPAKRR